MKFDFLSESDKAFFIHKASTLVEALPYIREHAGKIIVIKYGGHAMGDKNLAKSFSEDICLLKEVGIHPIIVHGGGPQIEDTLKKNNIKSKFIEGLRVTDKATIKIVEKVLANDINKKIVNDLKNNGGIAIGLKGNNNNLIKVRKFNLPMQHYKSNLKKILDLGFVGEPIKINKSLIKKNILKGKIPVIAGI